MAFVRKSFVKKRTVYFNSTNERIQIDYKMSYKLPEKYIRDCCEFYGFHIEKLLKIRYGNIVSYYAIKIKKK